ncbi:MAG: Hfq-like protein [Blastocatellia bacterium]
MNRKLIRTTLAEVKEREYHQQQVRRAEPPPQPQHRPSQPHQPHQPHGQALSKKKIPPEQTNAESFYYKKQMDAHTPMVIVLQDNEAIHGIIEWYDKNSLKIHREDGPNLLILKHNIKYLHKDEDAKGGKASKGDAESFDQDDDDDYDDSDDE